MGSSFLLMFPGLNKFKFAKVFLNLLLLINKSVSDQRNFQFAKHSTLHPLILHLRARFVFKACPPSAKNIGIVLIGSEPMIGTI